MINNMRIWSLHPKYLDTNGFIALWRKALLAKKVLEGKNKGYRIILNFIVLKWSVNL